MTVKLRWIMAAVGLLGVVAGLAWAGEAGLGVAAAGVLIYVLAAFS